MSRAYDMYVQVENFRTERPQEIRRALLDVWPFEWGSDEPDDLSGCGESSLVGGESEEQFSQRLAQAVWQANGSYCGVLVIATCLEDLPYETYDFDEGDYERMLGAASPGKLGTG